MDVLIVGGGIAGFALAPFLQAAGHHVEIVERAAHWERAGYGISLWSDGIAVLEALGVSAAFQEVGTVIERWELQDGKGEILAGIGLEYGSDAHPLTAVHRGDLHRVLREHAADVSVRMGTTVTGIEQDSRRVRARLSDGDEVAADLLVGADGVRSAVRDLCFQEASLRDTGTAVWSFWIPDDVDVPEGFTEQWAEGGRALLVAPIADRHMASLAAPVSSGELGDPVETLREQAGVGGTLLENIVAGLPADPEIFHDRLLEVDAPTWVNGRVVLIGDAAHALHPIVGMGASLALEDAQELSAELEEETGGATEAALQRFVSRRKSRLVDIRREAAVTRWITFTRSEFLASLRNGLVRHTPVMEMFMRSQVDEEDVRVRRLA